MPIDALKHIVCADMTRDLLAIAKFLFYELFKKQRRHCITL